MNQKTDNEQKSDSWKTKTLAIGAVIGALVGVSAAYLLVQKAERENGQVNVPTGDGLKLGLTVLGFLRQVAQLGDGE